MRVTTRASIPAKFRPFIRDMAVSFFVFSAAYAVISLFMEPAAPSLAHVLVGCAFAGFAASMGSLVALGLVFPLRNGDGFEPQQCRNLQVACLLSKSNIARFWLFFWFLVGEWFALGFFYFYGMDFDHQCGLPGCSDGWASDVAEWREWRAFASGLVQSFVGGAGGLCLSLIVLALVVREAFCEVKASAANKERPDTTSVEH